MADSSFTLDKPDGGETWRTKIATTGSNNIEMSLGYVDRTRWHAVMHFTPDQARSFAKALEALAIAAEAEAAD